MEKPKKKLVIRFYDSFEDQAADEAIVSSQRTVEQRLKDTVALIMRIYGVSPGVSLKRVITFN